MKNVIIFCLLSLNNEINVRNQCAEWKHKITEKSQGSNLSYFHQFTGVAERFDISLQTNKYLFLVEITWNFTASIETDQDFTLHVNAGAVLPLVRLTICAHRLQDAIDMCSSQGCAHIQISPIIDSQLQTPKMFNSTEVNVALSCFTFGSVPDDAELEAVVASTLDDGRVTHLHGGRVGTSQVLLVLDGLLHRLGQLAVTHFLQDKRGQREGQLINAVLGANLLSGQNRNDVTIK